MHDETVPIGTAAPPPGTYRSRPPEPAPRRLLAVDLEPRAAGMLGGFLARDDAGEVFTWIPVPFVAVRWRGPLRVAGLALGLAAALSIAIGLPPLPAALLAGWLALPAGSALWHAWLSGRLL